MPVVSAGVHVSRTGRTVRRSGFLIQHERINIAAERDIFSGSNALHDSHHVRLQIRLLRRDPQRRQTRPDPLRGLVFLSRHFRNAVQFVTEFHNAGQYFPDDLFHLRLSPMFSAREKPDRSPVL